ncbi:hypothetical protein [Nocardioides kribbensis]|uniref:Uncharacterized protein n=1 Tax=Nocardioides kribbensis TaxID=305517 RepID=A0ABV1NTG7_9ACTN
MPEPVPIGVWLVERSARLWRTLIDPWAEKVGRLAGEERWLPAGAHFVAGFVPVLVVGYGIGWLLGLGLSVPLTVMSEWASTIAGRWGLAVTVDLDGWLWSLFTLLPYGLRPASTPKKSGH